MVASIIYFVSFKSVFPNHFRQCHCHRRGPLSRHLPPRTANAATHPPLWSVVSRGVLSLSTKLFTPNRHKNACQHGHHRRFSHWDLFAPHDIVVVYMLWRISESSQKNWHCARMFSRLFHISIVQRSTIPVAPHVNI